MSVPPDLNMGVCSDKIEPITAQLEILPAPYLWSDHLFWELSLHISMSVTPDPGLTLFQSHCCFIFNRVFKKSSHCTNNNKKLYWRRFFFLFMYSKSSFINFCCSASENVPTFVKKKRSVYCDMCVCVCLCVCVCVIFFFWLLVYIWGSILEMLKKMMMKRWFVWWDRHMIRIFNGVNSTKLDRSRIISFCSVNFFVPKCRQAPVWHFWTNLNQNLIVFSRTVQWDALFTWAVCDQRVPLFHLLWYLYSMFCNNCDDCFIYSMLPLLHVL